MTSHSRIALFNTSRARWSSLRVLFLQHQPTHLGRWRMDWGGSAFHGSQSPRWKRDCRQMTAHRKEPQSGTAWNASDRSLKREAYGEDDWDSTTGMRTLDI